MTRAMRYLRLGDEVDAVLCYPLPLRSRLSLVRRSAADQENLVRPYIVTTMDRERGPRSTRIRHARRRSYLDLISKCFGNWRKPKRFCKTVSLFSVL